MKFAKELDRELVPEWRAKYLNYKVGKKKLKAINRAIRNANALTPRRGAASSSQSQGAPYNVLFNRGIFGRSDKSGDKDALDTNGVAAEGSGPNRSPRQNADGATQSKSILKTSSNEEQPLREGLDPRKGMRRYGSIIGSPPNRETLENYMGQRPPRLELPDPALDVNHPISVPADQTSQEDQPKDPLSVTPNNGNAFEVGITKAPPLHGSHVGSRYENIFKLKRNKSMPGLRSSRPKTSRIFSFGATLTPSPQVGTDVPLDAYREIDLRQAEFFKFLDGELEKIETFYKQKEQEAKDRLEVLRDQLHFMRDRRLDEIITNQAKTKNTSHTNGVVENGNDSGVHDHKDSKHPGRKNIMHVSWLNPLESQKIGKGTRALQVLGTPTSNPQQREDDRDYARRPEQSDVSYRTAKRKLKSALQEYYRGLELLKSYALLNRTAFRKITKKYDKTVHARPSGRYMAEKVNTSWFVKSDLLEHLIQAVEDLYARYFEQGNHKVAVGKLRVKSSRVGDYSESAFRNGAFATAGIVFGIGGLVYASQMLNSPNAVLAQQTKYLLQIYTGYFLMLLLVLLFCLDCRIWTRSKINYVFIFEFDTRHHLDWRQLAELPCFFLFLEGLLVWVNFSEFSGQNMFLYWPIVLIVLTAILLFFPAPVLYHRSRRWFLYSNWRLLMAGLYPVEFRDFFLGDMYCSQTFAMGNIEMFFCLYAAHFQNADKCNSNHSRLMGFFTTLPGIWRALQCIRRFHDTRNVFPHLVNCGKYTATIVYYVSLSLWRINGTTNNSMVMFIFFATINSVYCSIWDVIMDWSLGDPYAKYPLLRETLGYKHPWAYYIAIIIDPLLRFNWVFYVIFRHNTQHTALLSFFIALSEILRRGMWTIFRVENEHCTNVGRFRASRDIPLPYDLPTSRSSSEQAMRADEEQQLPQPIMSVHEVPSVSGEATGSDLSHTLTRDSIGRRRGRKEEPSPLLRGLSRVGTIMHTAHAQDFERRREPVGVDITEDDDDDDDTDDGEESDQGNPVREDFDSDEEHPALSRLRTT